MASSSVSSFGKTKIASPATQTETTNEVSGAQESIQSIWQDAYCLTWDDGFESEVLRATHILHDELRPLLQLGATIEACEKIECCSNAIMGVLAAWIVRNQLISRRTQFIVPKSPASDVEGLGFKYELQSLPTAAGCEANLKTAEKIQEYLASQIATPFAKAVFKNNVAFDLHAAERIRAYLAALRKRCAAVVSSAQRACHDTAGVRQSLPGFLMEITSEKEDQEELDNKLKKSAAKQARRERALGPLKALFGNRSPEEIRAHDRASQATSQRLDVLREYIFGISEAGTQPSLAALPPLSVAELQQQQKGVCAQFGPTQLKEKDEAQEAPSRRSRHDSVSGILLRTRASIAEMGKPSTNVAGPA